MRTISVVVPAASEVERLPAAVASVRAQDHPRVEVVAVVNGATDRTPEIARGLADRAIVTPNPLGYSRARNLGARHARGEVLVFLDADSELGPGALRAIERAAGPGVFGTVLGRPDPPRARYRAFFLMKNWAHRARLYRGALGGLLFCDAETFRAIGGFDPAKEVDEIYDFSRRARAAGFRHRLVTAAWSRTSMRRFERQGMLRTFGSWILFRFPFLAGRAAAHAERDYVG